MHKSYIVAEEIERRRNGIVEPIYVPKPYIAKPTRVPGGRFTTEDGDCHIVRSPSTRTLRPSKPLGGTRL